MRIYHNPRCSKSRATLEALKEKGFSPEIIEYLKNPPTPEELDQICKMLDLEPLELMRTKETRFKELGLTTSDNRPRKEWLEIMIKDPILIERPIVVTETKAAIGRPLESVLAII
jgi:arsenate reductase